MIKSCAMGGCIKVALKKIWFLLLHLAVNHSLPQIIFLFKKEEFFEIFV
jgi:hypothetical protein